MGEFRVGGRAWIAAFCAVAALVLGAAAAQAGPRRAAADPLVVLLLPESLSPRWERIDRPRFVAALRKRVPRVRIEVMNAGNDPTRQRLQANAAILRKPQALVVAASDPHAFAPTARRALALGVPVIAYDRLIPNARLTAYVSFDPVAIGRSQGNWLVRHTKKGSRIAIVNGSSKDESAKLYNKGSTSVLDPLFATGARKRVGSPAGIWVADWSPVAAQRETSKLLAQTHDGIDAVLAASDGVAGGVIAALNERRLAAKVPVTGQDASLQGVQNILLGVQGMSVFKDFRLEAPAAARVVAELLTGKPIGFDRLSRNGPAGLVRTIDLPIQAIDRSTLRKLVANGYVQAYLGGLKKVCAGMPRTSICK